MSDQIFKLLLNHVEHSEYNTYEEARLAADKLVVGNIKKTDIIIVWPEEMNTNSNNN